MQQINIRLLLPGNPLAADKLAVAVDKLATDFGIQGSAVDKLAAAVDKQVAKTQALVCDVCVCTLSVVRGLDGRLEQNQYPVAGCVVEVA
ncbi:MAG TPA: hypothetical protein PLW65_03100 [Pseudomonadota bacterium]|nr:hypothetical protein [Pseudomonadota bacterium]